MMVCGGTWDDKSCSYLFKQKRAELIWKLIGNLNRPQIAKTTSKKNKVRGFIFPDFKTYCKTTVIKKVQYWHKDRPTDPRIRIDRPEINPHTWLNDLWQEDQHHSVGKGQSL